MDATKRKWNSLSYLGVTSSTLTIQGEVFYTQHFGFVRSSTNHSTQLVLLCSNIQAGKNTMQVEKCLQAICLKLFHKIEAEEALLKSLWSQYYSAVKRQIKIQQNLPLTCEPN